MGGSFHRRKSFNANYDSSSIEMKHWVLIRTEQGRRGNFRDQGRTVRKKDRTTQTGKKKGAENKTGDLSIIEKGTVLGNKEGTTRVVMGGAKERQKV